MPRQPNPAQVRELIRSQVFKITGQRLTSRQIVLRTNPRADSRIAFDLAKRRIYWIAIAPAYWQGPENILRIVVTHEVMNTRVEYNLTQDDLDEAEEIRKVGSDVKKRIAIRTRFEVRRKGWKRILERKLQTDRLSLEWLRDNGYELMPYIQFLAEEWNAANQFSQPRRRYHRLIGAKRVREAAIFFATCVECKQNAR